MGTTETHKTHKSPPWYSMLGLLVWKNFLINKRHWMLSLLEVGLPTLLFGMIVLIRTLPHSILGFEDILDVTSFKPMSQLEMGKQFYGKLMFADDVKFMYGPNNTHTTDIMTKSFGLFFENPLFHLKFKLSDALHPVDSNEDIDQYMKELYLADKYKMPFYFGVFFHDMNSTDDIPQKLKYDLRFPKTWMTKYIYPLLEISGPRTSGNQLGDQNLGHYTNDSFLLIQTLIDGAFTNITNNVGNFTNNGDYPLSTTQMYPYPPYFKDGGTSAIFGMMIPSFLILSFILLCPSLIKSIVHEKETGVKELVRLMGLTETFLWTGWFLKAFITVFLNVFIITLLLKCQIHSANGLFPPVLRESNPLIIFLVLLLYGITSITFCFTISCFFNRPTLATTIGIVLWLSSQFVPNTFIGYNYDTLGLGPKMAICFIPNMAITLFFKLCSMFEGSGRGVQWDNIWEVGNPSDTLKIGHILIMLIVNIIVSGIATWYFDQVLPGQYGSPKSLTFPFQKSYWFPESNPTDNSSQVYTNQKNHEQTPQGVKSGISVRNLRQVFSRFGGGKTVAVDNGNMECLEGQCTVLLGHNGAGKTTTMSVITGVYKATAGEAYINGYSINTNLKKARRFIGLCPQHNTLFNDLTVLEHLLFFAVLKGLSWKEGREEANSLMERMEISAKKKQYGNQLSGGMKRKLCLSIAFIAGSPVVILDEPSSGLDPESRRSVWDLIQRERGMRTVLVTTHHMEEADVLGDRIIIMSAGKMVCSGSTLFLKKRYGAGYSLRILPTPNFTISRITQAINSVIPTAKLTTTTHEELIFNLPTDTSNFAKLLGFLSENKAALNINHIGLSLTTMEQVFLNVGEQEIASHAHDNPSYTIEKEIPAYKMASTKDMSEKYLEFQQRTANDNRLSRKNEGSFVRLEGGMLLLERARALFKKRWIYSKRKWVLMIAQSLIPILVTMMTLGVDMMIGTTLKVEPALKLDLSMFESSVSYFADHNEHGLSKCYKDQFQDPYKVSNTSNITATLLKNAPNDITLYRQRYITSADFSFTNKSSMLGKNEINMMYQSTPYHAAPIGINLVDNAILKHFTNESYSIETYNYPLPQDPKKQLTNHFSISSLLYYMMMPSALTFLAASFLVFHVEERESQAKQIQLMTGTPAWCLWSTSFLWDYCVYLVSALLVLVCFVAFNSNGYFLIDGVPSALFITLLLFGWASIPLSYVFSFLFKHAASGFSILVTINVVTGLILSLAVNFLGMSGQPELEIVANVIGNVSSLIPAYPVSYCFKKMIDVTSSNELCNILDNSTKTMFCAQIYNNATNSSSALAFKPCCHQCVHDDSVDCFEKLSYVSMDQKGMGKELIWMLGDGVFYIVLLVLIEIGFFKRIRSFIEKTINSKRGIQTFEVPEDEDVAKERDITDLLIKDTHPDSALVVSHLGKDFHKVHLRAVDDINFRVKNSECFALLGVNGAGKTTTFNMLTGKETPSRGDARIGKNFLIRDKNRFIQEIGYCPQFDAVIPELTGEEMLDLVGALRGIDIRERMGIVAELVDLIDLRLYANNQISTYSGGNKRKLSTALALIGEPSLVFLDEPTTGVDPASRRKVWSAIQAGRDRGQTIILTSHSMDECEALSSRIAILVRGQLRCTATPPQLKARYGKGFSLQVKLRVMSGDSSENLTDKAVASLRKTIDQRLGGSIITDEHMGMITYMVPKEHGWGKLFEVLEGLKSQKNSIVEDYAATDPSLEDVFLMFARESEMLNK